MDEARSKKYYVYTLSYPDGMVFYVGKGCSSARGYDRMNSHEQAARRPPSRTESNVCGIIRKIWANGEEVRKEKVYEGLTKDEALTLEKRVISRYKPEQLANKIQNHHYYWPLSPDCPIPITFEISEALRDQIQKCMEIDGIECIQGYASEYVQNICMQAIQDYVQHFDWTKLERIPVE